MSNSHDSRGEAVNHLRQARTVHLNTDKDRHIELARIWASVYASDVKLETTLV